MTLNQAVLAVGADARTAYLRHALERPQGRSYSRSNTGSHCPARYQGESTHMVDKYLLGAPASNKLAAETVGRSELSSTAIYIVHDKSRSSNARKQSKQTWRAIPIRGSSLPCIPTGFTYLSPRIFTLALADASDQKLLVFSLGDIDCVFPAQPVTFIEALPHAPPASANRPCLAPSHFPI
ncbi:hypothetical protein BC628DRAFT_1445950 [Trametes gibbosa]|nr:hypothetical protein BC628DRAFT_1445950 [Trametes gibbosa]